MPCIHEVGLETLASVLTSEEWAACDLYFVGDVGATHARLGFGRLDVRDYATPVSTGEPPVISPIVDGNVEANMHILYVHFLVSRASIRQLLDFFDDILAHIDSSVTRRIVASVVSVPGPVSNGTVAGPFNNLEGMIELSEFPLSLFNPNRSAMLNDVQAGAYGVLAISDALSQHYTSFFKLMWEGGESYPTEPCDKYSSHEGNNRNNGAYNDSNYKNGHGIHSTLLLSAARRPLAVKSALGRGHCLVIAPGTGLGSALIVYHSSTQCYQVLPLEFGCTCVSSLVIHQQNDANPLPSASLKGLADFLGCKHWEIKVEDLVCGKSLVYHYMCEAGLDLSSLSEDSKEPTFTAKHTNRMYSPEYIADLAKLGDPAARCALLAVYTYLFQLCSDLIMSVLPLNCVIIGDNIVKNKFLFNDAECEKYLHKSLHQHPMSKRGFMSRTSFFRQVEDVNLNLLGSLGFGIHLVNSWKKNKFFQESDL